MKKFLNLLLMVPFATAFMVGCQSEDITYSGPEYVMFSDTTYMMPILETDKIFEVPVATTTLADYDRNYAVEIINDKSTAIRGYHFDFVDNTKIMLQLRLVNVLLLLNWQVIMIMSIVTIAW